MWVLLDLAFGSLEHTLLVLKEFYFLLICRTLFYLDFHLFLWPSHLNPFSIVLHSSLISLILSSITWLILFIFSLFVLHDMIHNHNSIMSNRLMSPQSIFPAQMTLVISKSSNLLNTYTWILFRQHKFCFFKHNDHVPLKLYLCNT